jgi:host factor-I protein
VEAVNRKLIRPSFQTAKEAVSVKDVTKVRETPSPRENMNPVRSTTQKKPVPPDQTNAENFYYMKQMQSKTPMVIVLKDGEVLKGVIEWYDKCCLKFNRDGDPNLLLFKSNIKYMYKDE